MFIGSRYYNRDNISTIDYTVYTSYEDFEVRRLYNSKEAKETPWIYNKTKQEFREHRDTGWGGESFELLYEKDVLRYKNDAKEKRKIITEKGEEPRGYGLREKDVQEAENKAERLEYYLSKQKQLISRDILHEFVQNEGHITAHIKMNNGDEFDENLLGWSHYQFYKEEDKSVHTDRKVDRKYKDEEVNIEFIYDTLNGNNPKLSNDKEFI